MSDSQPIPRDSDLPLWGLVLLGVFYLVACFRAPPEYRRVAIRLGIPLLGPDRRAGRGG